ncbi:AAA family ATPase [Streptomyces sp. H28]|uniref:ATP-binding protein n=1 Tax=Streptomyces sp. H28 TaxID=2775865 RepID=UPI00177C2513|nr:LuxR family transcriptional regulator [Streptomyces sp. H28]MBD9730881.1 AAA family ATPase [Streptomyces sp. H28]
MLGRIPERGVMDRLAADVRAGRSAALVVRGEAGLGKTALLDHLAAHAPGCRTARADGSEAEMELPFAGLHQLCGPLLAGRDHLAAPQSEALDVAFGLAKGPPPDAFLLGLAILNQLAEVARERPLICLVDDAQWFDRASVQVLGFVARRLQAESVGLVFAVREPDDERTLDGLPGLWLDGLADDDARALLRSVIPGVLDENVRSRILAEARGNPLALMELPRSVTEADLAGGFTRPAARPAASRIEESFRVRVQSLPPATQRLLLLAAAEPGGDLTLLHRAAERLGLSMDAASPALALGLIEFGGRFRFRHPLVRSAAYRVAAETDRTAAHRALAEATDPDLDADRRAWHRALATVLPQEDVAADLARCADRARARGGLAAAAAFLERAMELTPDPARRSARALTAAEAKFEAAAVEPAHQLARAAQAGPLDAFGRARLARLHARIVFARSRTSEATPLFLDAARRLEPLDAALARETYLEALAAAIFAGRLDGGTTVRDAAEVARAAPRASGTASRTDLLLEGVTQRFTDGYAASLAPLRQALNAFRAQADSGGPGETARWLWLSCPVAPEPIAPEVWDDEAWHELADSAVRLARGAGALASLPVALSYRAGVHLQAGEFAEASALIEEADALTAATGTAPSDYTSLMLTAWRDDEQRALRVIGQAVRTATGRGEGRALGLAHHATALLYNGLARHEAALESARRACAYQDLGFYGWYLVELVEAAARSGDRDTAVAAVDRLDGMTRAAGTDWALGLRARSRALISEGGTAEEHHREAVERLGRTRSRVELARAHLVFGEWLRRENRRRDARAHLRTAHTMLTGFGAGAFTDRAARELLATGEKAAGRRTERVALTPQEARIAGLARDGLTNPEIGAQLFLSPHTVEWHLRKVFTKLGVTSRRHLRTALAAHDPAGGA